MNFLETINIEDENNDFDYKKYIDKKEDVKKRLNDYLTGKIKRGYGIKLPVLDSVIVCKSNEMFACVGKKGRGKTTIQQILFLMWAMVHDLVFVLCLQENENALAFKDLLGYLLGDVPKKILKSNPELHEKAVEWINNHFIFLTDIDDFKQATEVTEALIKSGIKVQALFLDPVNTIDSGWYNTGNSYQDDKRTAKRLLKFSKKTCSLFLSQHPTMAAQRSNEDVNSYSAEGGHFLNKADFTWVINRDNGSNANRVSVDNVRNTYTGGGITEPDSPLVIHWGKYNIDVEREGEKEIDIIQKIRKRFNPLKETFEDEFLEEKKELPKVNPLEAFGENNKDNNEDEKDVPF